MIDALPLFCIKEEDLTTKITCFHYTTPQNGKEIVGEPGFEPEPFSPKEKRRSKSVNNLLYDSEENFSSNTAC